MKIIKQYNNAKKVISEIKAGDWVENYRGYDFSNKSYPKYLLWTKNGGFFLDILIEDIRYRETNAFGYIFRHWVYFHIKSLRKDLRQDYFVEL